MPLEEPVATPAEVVAPVEQVQSPVEQVESMGFRERFEAAGFDLTGYDDDKLFQAVQHGLQRASRADELEAIAAQARPYLDHASEIDEFLRSKQAEQQPAKAAEKPNPWKAPLDYDPEWEKFTTFDPQLGRYILKDEAARYVSPAVAENMNKFKSWERERSQQIVRNFPDAVKEAVADLLAEQETKFDQRLNAHTETMQKMALAQKFLRDNAKDLFQHDANGQIMVDAQGREVPTPKGQLFDHFAGEARRKGLQSPEDVIEYAQLKSDKYLAEANAAEAERKKLAAVAAKKAAEVNGAAPPTGPITPSEKNAVQKESFLARSVREARKGNVALPSRESDLAAVKEGRRSKLSFSQILREEMQKQGFND